MKCPVSHVCVGGRGDDQCLTGYSGLGCAQCAHGYFRGDSGTCQPCGSTSPVDIAFLVTGAILLLITFIYLPSRTFLLAWMAGLKPVLQAMQLLNVIVQTQVAFQSDGSSLVGVTDIAMFRFTTLQPECRISGTSAVGLWIFQFLPIASVMIVAAVLYLRTFPGLLYRRQRLDTNGLSILRRSRLGSYGIMMSVWSLMYLPLLRMALDPFACVAQGNGSYVMESNGVIACYDTSSSEWMQLIYLNCITATLAVAPAVFAMYFTWRAIRMERSPEFRSGSLSSELFRNVLGPQISDMSMKRPMALFWSTAVCKIRDTGVLLIATFQTNNSVA